MISSDHVQGGRHEIRPGHSASPVVIGGLVLFRLMSVCVVREETWTRLEAE